MEKALRRMSAPVRAENRSPTDGAEKSAAEVAGGGERLTASPSRSRGRLVRAITQHGGNQAMPRNVEFIPDAVDYGTAYEFTATGVRRMFMISPHILRIAFVRLDMRDDREEHQVSGYMDCDVDQLPGIIALMRQGLADLVEQPSEAVPARTSMSAH
jgi:hypothetical protein